MEIYNNTDQDIVVQAVDISGGWAVVTSDGQITRFFINIEAQNALQPLSTSPARRKVKQQ